MSSRHLYFQIVKNRHQLPRFLTYNQKRFRYGYIKNFFQSVKKTKGKELYKFFKEQTEQSNPEIQNEDNTVENKLEIEDTFQKEKFPLQTIAKPFALKNRKSKKNLMQAKVEEKTENFDDILSKKQSQVSFYDVQVKYIEGINDKDKTKKTKKILRNKSTHDAQDIENNTEFRKPFNYNFFKKNFNRSEISVDKSLERCEARCERHLKTIEPFKRDKNNDSDHKLVGTIDPALTILKGKLVPLKKYFHSKARRVDTGQLLKQLLNQLKITKKENIEKHIKLQKSSSKVVNEDSSKILNALYDLLARKDELKRVNKELNIKRSITKIVKKIKLVLNQYEGKKINANEESNTDSLAALVNVDNGLIETKICNHCNKSLHYLKSFDSNKKNKRNNVIVLQDYIVHCSKNEKTSKQGLLGTQSRTVIRDLKMQVLKAKQDEITNKIKHLQESSAVRLEFPLKLPKYKIQEEAYDSEPAAEENIIENESKDLDQQKNYKQQIVELPESDNILDGIEVDKKKNDVKESKEGGILQKDIEVKKNNQDEEKGEAKSKSKIRKLLFGTQETLETNEIKRLTKDNIFANDAEMETKDKAKKNETEYIKLPKTSSYSKLISSLKNKIQIKKVKEFEKRKTETQKILQEDKNQVSNTEKIHPKISDLRLSKLETLYKFMYGDPKLCTHDCVKTSNENKTNLPISPLASTLEKIYFLIYGKEYDELLKMENNKINTSKKMFLNKLYSFAFGKKGKEKSIGTNAAQDSKKLSEKKEDKPGDKEGEKKADLKLFTKEKDGDDNKKEKIKTKSEIKESEKLNLSKGKSDCDLTKPSITNDTKKTEVKDTNKDVWLETLNELIKKDRSKSNTDTKVKPKNENSKSFTTVEKESYEKSIKENNKNFLDKLNIFLKDKEEDKIKIKDPLKMFESSNNLTSKKSETEKSSWILKTFSFFDQTQNTKKDINSEEKGEKEANHKKNSKISSDKKESVKDIMDKYQSTKKKSHHLTELEEKVNKYRKQNLEDPTMGDIFDRYQNKHKTNSDVSNENKKINLQKSAKFDREDLLQIIRKISKPENPMKKEKEPLDRDSRSTRSTKTEDITILSGNSVKKNSIKEKNPGDKQENIFKNKEHASSMKYDSEVENKKEAGNEGQNDTDDLKQFFKEKKNVAKTLNSNSTDQNKIEKNAQQIQTSKITRNSKNNQFGDNKKNTEDQEHSYDLEQYFKDKKNVEVVISPNYTDKKTMDEYVQQKKTSNLARNTEKENFEDTKNVEPQKEEDTYDLEQYFKDLKNAKTTLNLSYPEQETKHYNDQQIRSSIIISNIENNQLEENNKITEAQEDSYDLEHYFKDKKNTEPVINPNYIDQKTMDEYAQQIKVINDNKNNQLEENNQNIEAQVDSYDLDQYFKDKKDPVDIFNLIETERKKGENDPLQKINLKLIGKRDNNKQSEEKKNVEPVENTHDIERYVKEKEDPIDVLNLMVSDQKEFEKESLRKTKSNVIRKNEDKKLQERKTLHENFENSELKWDIVVPLFQKDITDSRKDKQNLIKTGVRLLRTHQLNSVSYDVLNRSIVEELEKLVKMQPSTKNKKTKIKKDSKMGKDKSGNSSHFAGKQKGKMKNKSQNHASDNKQKIKENKLSSSQKTKTKKSKAKIKDKPLKYKRLTKKEKCRIAVTPKVKILNKQESINLLNDFVLGSKHHENDIEGKQVSSIIKIIVNGKLYNVKRIRKSSNDDCYFMFNSQKLKAVEEQKEILLKLFDCGEKIHYSLLKQKKKNKTCPIWLRCVSSKPMTITNNEKNQKQNTEQLLSTKVIKTTEDHGKEKSVEKKKDLSIIHQKKQNKDIFKCKDKTLLGNIQEYIKFTAVQLYFYLKSLNLFNLQNNILQLTSEQDQKNASSDNNFNAQKTEEYEKKNHRNEAIGVDFMKEKLNAEQEKNKEIFQVIKQCLLFNKLSNDVDTNTKDNISKDMKTLEFADEKVVVMPPKKEDSSHKLLDKLEENRNLIAKKLTEKMNHPNIRPKNSTELVSNTNKSVKTKVEEEVTANKSDSSEFWIDPYLIRMKHQNAIDNELQFNILKVALKELHDELSSVSKKPMKEVDVEFKKLLTDLIKLISKNERKVYDKADNNDKLNKLFKLQNTKRYKSSRGPLEGSKWFVNNNYSIFKNRLKTEDDKKVKIKSIPKQKDIQYSKNTDGINIFKDKKQKDEIKVEKKEKVAKFSSNDISPSVDEENKSGKTLKKIEKSSSKSKTETKAQNVKNKKAEDVLKTLINNYLESEFSEKACKERNSLNVQTLLKEEVQKYVTNIQYKKDENKQFLRDITKTNSLEFPKMYSKQYNFNNSDQSKESRKNDQTNKKVFSLKVNKSLSKNNLYEVIKAVADSYYCEIKMNHKLPNNLLDRFVLVKHFEEKYQNENNIKNNLTNDKELIFIVEDKKEKTFSLTPTTKEKLFHIFNCIFYLPLKGKEIFILTPDKDLNHNIEIKVNDDTKIIKIIDFSENGKNREHNYRNEIIIDGQLNANPLAANQFSNIFTEDNEIKNTEEKTFNSVNDENFNFINDISQKFEKKIKNTSLKYCSIDNKNQTVRFKHKSCNGRKIAEQNVCEGKERPNISRSTIVKNNDKNATQTFTKSMVLSSIENAKTEVAKQEQIRNYKEQKDNTINLPSLIKKVIFQKQPEEKLKQNPGNELLSESKEEEIIKHNSEKTIKSINENKDHNVNHYENKSVKEKNSESDKNAENSISIPQLIPIYGLTYKTMIQILENILLNNPKVGPDFFHLLKMLDSQLKGGQHSVKFGPGFSDKDFVKNFKPFYQVFDEILKNSEMERSNIYLNKLMKSIPRSKLLITKTLLVQVPKLHSEKRCNYVYNQKMKNNIIASSFNYKENKTFSNLEPQNSCNVLEETSASDITTSKKLDISVKNGRVKEINISREKFAKNKPKEKKYYLRTQTSLYKLITSANRNNTLHKKQVSKEGQNILDAFTDVENRNIDHSKNNCGLDYVQNLNQFSQLTKIQNEQDRTEFKLLPEKVNKVQTQEPEILETNFNREINIFKKLGTVETQQDIERKRINFHHSETKNEKTSFSSSNNCVNKRNELKNCVSDKRKLPSVELGLKKSKIVDVIEHKTSSEDILLKVNIDNSDPKREKIEIIRRTLDMISFKLTEIVGKSNSSSNDNQEQFVRDILGLSLLRKNEKGETKRNSQHSFNKLVKLNCGINIIKTTDGNMAFKLGSCDNDDEKENVYDVHEICVKEMMRKRKLLTTTDLHPLTLQCCGINAENPNSSFNN